MSTPHYRLVSVNTAPERAKRILGRVIEEVKGTYDIEHVANIDRIEDVEEVVAREQPDLLFTASMWTAEQAQEIVGIAKRVKPDLKTQSMPEGLHIEKGPDGVVEYIKENLPGVLG